MFIPDRMYDTVYDIPDAYFTENGIKYLFVDIDNTLVPYEIQNPTKENIDWFERMEKLGIKLFFVSNNGIERVKKYTENLEYKYNADIKKPLVKRYKKFMAENGADAGHSMAIGDQIFTDVVSAKRIGMKAVLVKPIKDKKTAFFRFKRIMEKPFIAIYKSREKREGKI
jgi:HAD superfamily phosphatase (TIGR01668 family)